MGLDEYPLGVYYIDTPRGYISGKKELPMEQKECCCCSGRTKERSDEEVKKLFHRLNRIEGQIRGIRGMLEKKAYCIDILGQVSAANAALNAFGKELLAEHIRSCVVQDIREGRDETIEELVNTLQKLMK